MILTAATCLALAIYHEARGEPIDGRVMVAATIMERVDRAQWPDTVCGVVMQPRQFAWVNPATGKYPTPTDSDAWASALVLAEAILDDPDGTLPEVRPDHFHSGRAPVWADARKRLATIGRHFFYRL